MTVLAPGLQAGEEGVELRGGVKQGGDGGKWAGARRLRGLGKAGELCVSAAGRG